MTAQTLELLWRAAPEQVAELDKLFAAGIQARLTKDQPGALGVYFNALQIPESVLQQLWLLSHAAWQDLLAFDELKKSGKKSESLLTADAVAAAQEISKGTEVHWAPSIPEFGKPKEGLHAKAVRELYAMAGAWTILHEIQHAKFYESPSRPHDPIEEEMKCDSYAAEMLFSKIEEYSKLTGEAADLVRGKRAMAAIVGLYYVAKLSQESVVSKTHPRTQDRIKLLFEKVGSEPAKHFWGFATALMWALNPKIADMSVKIHDPSDRELAYVALEYAFS